MRKHMLAVPVLVAVLAGSAVGVTAQDEADPDGLVTEEVEPGVERIIRDDAGHDLDERHPRYRYDMDGVAVTPDGTVVLRTSLHSTDNFGNPGGRLVWALGQPGTTRQADVDCFTEGIGVTCIDDSEEATSYLIDTPINAVAVAPDGAVWAVGGHDGENGGLYRITRD
jgi:hypothetical protein